MVEPALQAQIDGARAYESLFVPALFSQWAPKVASAAQIAAGDRALDVACGTGVLAREVAARIGARGHVVGIDPNPGMLAVARRLGGGIDWHQGEAESLPFPDRSFDVVVCQFGLMFFSDRRRALEEMQRVLVPGGRLAIAVWDSIERIPAYAEEAALFQRIAGVSAADAVRVPFALGDKAALAELCSTSGVAAPEIVTGEGTARFPSIGVMIEADLRGWLPVMGVNLAEDQCHTILHEAERLFSKYAAADGSVSFPVSAHIISATR